MAAFDAIGEIGLDATVVFVKNHRSNLNCVLVTWLAVDRSALSWLIRAHGACFIRGRSASPFYRWVLARDVQKAAEAGVAQADFPEGGLLRAMEAAQAILTIRKMLRRNGKGLTVPAREAALVCLSAAPIGQHLAAGAA